MESTALAKTTDDGASHALATIDDGLAIEVIVARVEKMREVQKRLMQKDQHYGVIPGTPKPTLLKPGAELLCLTFQLAASFTREEHRDGEHLEVIATCTLTHAPTGRFLGSEVGSCSTREAKYAYRMGRRACPECGTAAISKSQPQYGGGWYCNKKAGGCGANFKKGDDAIEGQESGRIANPDLADQYNTVRKMACKRARIAAVLSVCGASELFTQDLEDMAGDDDGRDAKPANGNGGKRGGGQGTAQKLPAATDAQVAAFEKRIDLAQTVDELDAIRAEARESYRFTRGQGDGLNDADRIRRGELTDPDADLESLQ